MEFKVSLFHCALRWSSSLGRSSSGCGGGSSVVTMAERACTVRTRKFMTNRLLARKQFVSDSLQPFPFCVVFFLRRRTMVMAVTRKFVAGDVMEIWLLFEFVAGDAMEVWLLWELSE